MTITFKDVAKLARVSTQTVSRVINGSPNVSDTTREVVNQAIKTLGYIPNKNAQILSRNQSNLIGIISLDISLHGVALTTNGIRKTAKKVGYATAFSVSESINFENVKQSIHELLSQKVDGIVINIPLDAKTAEQIQSQYPNTPMIFIEASPDAEVNIIYNENKTGALLAAEHLIAQNRKHFILITGDEASTASKIRVDTWKKALLAANRHIVKIYQGDWKTSSGYISVRQAIADKLHFDAILCANDQMALGALCALNSHGISIPKQVSVVGFDDTQDSGYFTPALTTIRQNFEEIGHVSVLKLIELIKNKMHFKEWIQNPNQTKNELEADVSFEQDTWIKESIGVELIIRESSIPNNHSKENSTKEQLIQQMNTLRDLIMNMPE